jgi:hypothetical protein
MANRSVATTLSVPDDQLLAKEPAGHAFWLAWGYTASQSRECGNAKLLDKCERLWDGIAAKYTSGAPFPDGGFWGHLQLLESLRFLSTVKAVDPARLAAWKSAMHPEIEKELASYGHVNKDNWASAAAKQYPNADAQYAAVMYAAYLVYGDDRYKASASEFVQAMDKFLRPPGAWLYYLSSTPIPLYHGFEVTFLGRYYQLSHDESAADQLRRTAKFYPYTFAPENTVEYSSAPWWKQGWNPVGGPYHAVELVAWVSGDPYNRWFADLRAKQFEPYYWVVYYGEAWDAAQAKPVAPLPFPDRYVVEDKSVDGLRGRFGAFSWVGARGKNTISFGGAMLANAAMPLGYDGYVQFAHLGIRVPGTDGKPYFNAIRLIGDPASIPTPGAQSLDKESAALAVRYTPRLQGKPDASYDDWTVDEIWQYMPTAVVAAFEATALKDNPGTLPEGLVRLGPIARPHALDGKSFNIGGLNGKILASDFDAIAMADGEPDELAHDARVNVSLKFSSPLATITKGQRFGYIIAFTPSASTVIESSRAKDGTVNVTVDGVKYSARYDGGNRMVRTVPRSK